MAWKGLTVLTWWRSGTVKYAWRRRRTSSWSCSCSWRAATRPSCIDSASVYLLSLTLAHTLMSLAEHLSLACWPTQIHSASPSLVPQSMGRYSLCCWYHPVFPDWRTASFSTCDFDSRPGMRLTGNCRAVRYLRARETWLFKARAGFIKATAARMTAKDIWEHSNTVINTSHRELHVLANDRLRAGTIKAGGWHYPLCFSLLSTSLYRDPNQQFVKVSLNTSSPPPCLWSWTNWILLQKL